MGSLEEERLVQMVDDFIESDQTPNSCSSNSLPLPLSTKTHYYFFRLKEILGNGGKAEREVGETVMKQLRSKRDAPKTTSLKKWLVMKLKMDGYDSCRLRHSCWANSMGCPAGDYEYIETKVEDESGSRIRLIIDIEFKAQFEVARATAGYRKLTEALPSVFVGTEEKVVRIISILCAAAKQSLRESGLHIPPWRTSSYMQCKWVVSGRGQHQREAEESNSGNEFEKREEDHEEDGGVGLNQWQPAPMVKLRRKALGGGSALSTQFSNMSSINCC